MTVESITGETDPLSVGIKLKQEHTNRWIRRGYEDLEEIPIPEALKVVVRTSLETPQVGPHHNEGLEMAAHLGLIMEIIDAINTGSFDFKKLRLPPELEEKTKERISKAIQNNYEQMKIYAYLHDIAKPQCMNIENKDKQQRVFTMEEWRLLVAENHGNKQKAAQSLLGQGYNKIGYRISGDLAKEQKTEDKDHGDEGVKIIMELAARNKEVKKFTENLGLILKGIANHEIHFSVFNNAKSAKKFEACLANNFSEDEIDFIYAVCLIDMAGSLGENGEADFQGFRNMVTARENYNLIMTSGLEHKQSLMNLESVDEIQRKIKQLEQEKAIRKIKMEQSDVDAILEQALPWGITDPEDLNQLGDILRNHIIGQENPIAILGRTLPPKLKSFIKNIKEYLNTKLSL